MSRVGAGPCPGRDDNRARRGGPNALHAAHLLRQDRAPDARGRLVGSVLRILRDIDAAEEVAQEAFERALDRWPAAGTPDRPGAWLLTTARRLALDRLRRARRAEARVGALAYEVAFGSTDNVPDVTDPEAIPDDRLRLIFTCCHPGLPADSRVALTLRLVGGLTTAEIARAFLVPEPTIAQRLVRAARADFLRRLGRRTAAAAEYRRALDLADNARERAFLASRLAACESSGEPTPDPRPPE